MSARLGLDFTALPRLVTVRFTSAAHEGRPHTDSASKVATLLLYLHPGWTSPEGRIRVLRREALEDPVEEISPAEGNVLAFLRSDRSWQGHTPFIGERRSARSSNGHARLTRERRVVQVTGRGDAKERKRKRRRGKLAWWLKGLRRP